MTRSRHNSAPAALLTGIVLGVLLLCASGCGSQSKTLAPKVATAYVDAEARALCLVQSKAFPTQAALHAAFVRAENSANLSADDLTKARSAAARDVALRQRISNRVAARCGKR